MYAIIATGGKHGCSHEERHDSGIYLCQFHNLLTFHFSLFTYSIVMLSIVQAAFRPSSDVSANVA